MPAVDLPGGGPLAAAAAQAAPRAGEGVAEGGAQALSRVRAISSKQAWVRSRRKGYSASHSAASHREASTARAPPRTRSRSCASRSDRSYGSSPPKISEQGWKGRAGAAGSCRAASAVSPSHAPSRSVQWRTLPESRARGGSNVPTAALPLPAAAPEASRRVAVPPSAAASVRHTSRPSRSTRTTAPPAVRNGARPWPPPKPVVQPSSSVTGSGCGTGVNRPSVHSTPRSGRSSTRCGSSPRRTGCGCGGWWPVTSGTAGPRTGRGSGWSARTRRTPGSSPVGAAVRISSWSEGRAVGRRGQRGLPPRTWRAAARRAYP